jgi:hypothetical protein
MAPSTFGWVDFAAGDQEKIAEVIKLFSEPDFRDELGLGTVRDALAALFFPGMVLGRKNHYGSKSLRGPQVAALFYS